MVGASFWTDMRKQGFVVIDFPARQVAVFPNDAGQVVVASQDDGTTSLSILEPDEVHSFVAAVLKAGTTAKAINVEMTAGDDAHCVIEKARGDFA